MAIKKTKSKPKAKAVEVTLWDVQLSYPDLSDPKPYKGKIYYRVDGIFSKKSPTYRIIQEAIQEVCETQWGDDESEWPESIKGVQNGDDREDSKGYAGKYFITASTQSPVPVVDFDGNKFNPKNVQGGMYGNLAVRVSAWEFDGDEGLSIYLQGVQVDTEKEFTKFGGGRSVEQMFSKKKSKGRDDEDSDDQDDEEEDEDEDERPAKKSKKKPSRRDEEDEEDEDEEESRPVKKKARPSRDEEEDEDEEDERPRKKSSASKKRSRDFDDED